MCQSPMMEVLTALPLGPVDWFGAVNCDICGWFRTEAAAAANEVNEAPHWAMAEASRATSNINETAILTSVKWILLNLAVCSRLLNLSRHSMPGSFAAGRSLLFLGTREFFKHMSISFRTKRHT